MKLIEDVVLTKDQIREAYEAYKKQSMIDDLGEVLDNRLDPDVADEMMGIDEDDLLERAYQIFDRGLANNDSYMESYWLTAEESLRLAAEEIKQAKQPTKKTLVEVVRCGECKFFNDGDCTQVARLVGESSFCDLGEKKEDK